MLISGRDNASQDFSVINSADFQAGTMLHSFVFPVLVPCCPITGPTRYKTVSKWPSDKAENDHGTHKLFIYNAYVFSLWWFFIIASSSIKEHKI